jgi:hypothetical protein
LSKTEVGVTTIARGTVITEDQCGRDVELLGSVKGEKSLLRRYQGEREIVGDLVGKDIDLIACAVQEISLPAVWLR